MLKVMMSFSPLKILAASLDVCGKLTIFRLDVDFDIDFAVVRVKGVCVRVWSHRYVQYVV